MKKQFAALLTALSLLPTLALAQEYYTLPEIREQAKDGWHETYTDRYGRETVVDIDVEVYGGENAPILQVGWLNVEDEKRPSISGTTESAKRQVKRSAAQTARGRNLLSL